MGAPYSPDLRERVIAAVDGGLGAYASAAVFRVSVSYIYKALGRRRATGETTARASGRGPAQKLAPFNPALHFQSYVARSPNYNGEARHYEKRSTFFAHSVRTSQKQGF